MPSRKVFFLESLAAAQVSSATRTKVTALSFTNVGGASYFVGGSWCVRCDTAQNNAATQLIYMEAAATATVCDFGFAPVSASEMNGQFGFRRITTPASVGTQVINLTMKVCAATRTSEITNVRLWAIKSTAADAYGESDTLRQIPASQGWQAQCSATFTPASQGNYIVMGVGGVTIQQGGQKHKGGRITHQGTAAGNSYMGMYSEGGVLYPRCFPAIDVLNMTAASNTIEYQFGACAGVNTVTANCHFGRIAALRADAFNAVINAASDVTASISAATFVTAMTTAFSMTGGLKYGILSMARPRATSLVNSQVINFMIDGVTAGDHILLNQGTAPGDYQWSWQPDVSMVIVTASQGMHEFYYKGRLTATGGELNFANQRIIVMQFDATAAAGTVPIGYFYYDHMHRFS